MKKDDLSPSRRSFLRGTLLIPPITSASLPFGILALAGCEQEQPKITGSAPPSTDPATAYTPTYFNEEEWKFLNAACERLIPTDDNGPGAVTCGVPEFIDRQMNTSYGSGGLWYMQGPFHDAPPELGYQSRLTPREVYRLGIGAINQHCMKQFSGKAFAELTAEQQDALLQQLEKGDLTFEQVAGKSFFAFLLQNSKEGYLADPIHGGNKNMASWKLIGFPGARADFTDWADQPNKKYPFPPVSINGKRG